MLRAKRSEVHHLRNGACVQCGRNAQPTHSARGGIWWLQWCWGCSPRFWPLEAFCLRRWGSRRQRKLPRKSRLSCGCCSPPAGTNAMHPDPWEGQRNYGKNFEKPEELQQQSLRILCQGQVTQYFVPYLCLGCILISKHANHAQSFAQIDQVYVSWFSLEMWVYSIRNLRSLVDLANFRAELICNACLRLHGKLLTSSSAGKTVSLPLEIWSCRALRSSVIRSGGMEDKRFCMASIPLLSSRISLALTVSISSPSNWPAKDDDPSVKTMYIRMWSHLWQWSSNTASICGYNLNSCSASQCLTSLYRQSAKYSLAVSSSKVGGGMSGATELMTRCLFASSLDSSSRVMCRYKAVHCVCYPWQKWSWLIESMIHNPGKTFRWHWDCKFRIASSKDKVSLFAQVDWEAHHQFPPH